MIGLGNLRTQNCQQIRRRELLQMGACSALGLSLPQWLAGTAQAESPSPVKSVMLLWMWGGPSHHEMWDPKPNAPAKIRGCYSPIATASPG